MSIVAFERTGDSGEFSPVPAPGTSTTETTPAPTPSNGLHADVQEGSAPPASPPQPSESLAASPEAEGDEPDLPEDAPVTASHLNKRIGKLTARHRSTERELVRTRAEWERERAVSQARIDTLTQMVSGAAPALPEPPPHPTGPPQPEQFELHADYVMAAARYGAQQELQARDQQTHAARQAQSQAAFQAQLAERVQTFQETHPDYGEVVNAGYVGKVAPHVDQIVSFLPDGPALAYQLARQPDLVARLNTLPPPLVVWELRGLMPAAPATPSNGTLPPAVTNGAPPAQTPPALPNPMPPVGGGGSMQAPVFNDAMSMAEYRAMRKRTSDLPIWRER